MRQLSKELPISKSSCAYDNGVRNSNIVCSSDLHQGEHFTKNSEMCTIVMHKSVVAKIMVSANEAGDGQVKDVAVGQACLDRAIEQNITYNKQSSAATNMNTESQDDVNEVLDGNPVSDTGVATSLANIECMNMSCSHAEETQQGKLSEEEQQIIEEIADKLKASVIISKKNPALCEAMDKLNIADSKINELPTKSDGISKVHKMRTNKDITKASDDTAKTDEIVTKADGISPKAEDIILTGDNIAPKRDDIASKADDIVIKVADIPSKADDVASKADVSSKVDDIAPKGDDIAPKSDDVALKVDDIAPKADDVVPKADDIVPKADGIMHKADYSVPKADDIVPKADGVAPKVDGISPKVDGVAPKVDGVAPKADGVAPKADGIAPKADGISPKEDGIAPKVDGVAPKADGVAPKADGVAPKADDVASKSCDIAPKADCIAPKADCIAPKADGVAPKSDGVAPKADGVAPKADGVAPKVDCIAPKADCIAPNSKADCIAPKADCIAPTANCIAPKASDITTKEDDNIPKADSMITVKDRLKTAAELVPKGLYDGTNRTDEESATTDVMIQRSPINNLSASTLRSQGISPQYHLGYPTTFQFQFQAGAATTVNIYPDNYNQLQQQPDFVANLERSMSCDSELPISNTDITNYDPQNKKTMNSSELFREMFDQIGADVEPSSYANICSPASSYIPMSPISPNSPSVIYSPATPSSSLSPPYSPASSATQDSLAGSYHDSYQYIPNIDLGDREVELNDALEVINNDCENHQKHPWNMNSGLESIQITPLNNNNNCQLPAVLLPPISHPLSTISNAIVNESADYMSTESMLGSARTDITTSLNVVPNMTPTMQSKRDKMPEQRRKMVSAYVPIRPRPPYTKSSHRQKEKTAKIKSNSPTEAIKDACCSCSCVKPEGEIDRQLKRKADSLVWSLTREQMMFVDLDGDTLLHQCAMRKWSYRAKALICRYTRDKQLAKVINVVNKLKQTALHLATIVNDSRSVRILISAGADPNLEACTCGPQKTASALHVAALQGDCALACVTELLKCVTIDVRRSCNGRTPLHCAVSKHGNEKGICSKQIIKTLVLHGASLTEPDGMSGKTPLHLACYQCDVDLLAWLIDLLPVQSRPAALTQQTFDGNSCLHEAASTRHGSPDSKLALVQLLLSHGGDPSRRNRDNKLPKNLVINHPQLFSVLHMTAMSANKASAAKCRGPTGSNINC